MLGNLDIDNQYHYQFESVKRRLSGASKGNARARERGLGDLRLLSAARIALAISCVQTRSAILDFKKVIHTR